MNLIKLPVVFILLLKRYDVIWVIVWFWSHNLNNLITSVFQSGTRVSLWKSVDFLFLKIKCLFFHIYPLPSKLLPHFFKDFLFFRIWSSTSCQSCRHASKYCQRTWQCIHGNFDQSFSALNEFTIPGAECGRGAAFWIVLGFSWAAELELCLSKLFIWNVSSFVIPWSHKFVSISYVFILFDMFPWED